jgi:hypothetical protein
MEGTKWSVKINARNVVRLAETNCPEGSGKREPDKNSRPICMIFGERVERYIARRNI